MKRGALTIALLAVASTAAVGATASEGVSFLAELSRARPDVRWDASTFVAGDFDGDGKSDAAAVGYAKAGIVLAVGMHKGSTRFRIQYLDFAVSAAKQAAICATPAHLSGFPLSCASDGAPLPGCVESPHASALTLFGGECDPINLYWNHHRGSIDWWRN
jgi:hypothetical protein